MCPMIMFHLVVVGKDGNWSSDNDSRLATTSFDSQQSNAYDSRLRHMIDYRTGLKRIHLLLVLPAVHHRPMVESLPNPTRSTWTRNVETAGALRTMISYYLSLSQRIISLEFVVKFPEKFLETKCKKFPRNFWKSRKFYKNLGKSHKILKKKFPKIIFLFYV